MYDPKCLLRLPFFVLITKWNFCSTEQMKQIASHERVIFVFYNVSKMPDCKMSKANQKYLMVTYITLNLLKSIIPCTVACSISMELLQWSPHTDLTT